MEEIEVWGIGGPRNLRVHWTLEELGRNYKCHPIVTRSGDANTDEYRKLNPREKIPTLRHNGFLLTESAAIAIYLSETLPSPEGFFVPVNTEGRARINEWCFFVMVELDALSLYVSRRHLGLKNLFGEAPNAVKAGREYFIQQMGAMAPRANSSGQYLMGDKFSVADILMVTCIEWAKKEEIEVQDEWLKYLSRVIKRPAYKRATEYNNSYPPV